MHRFNFVLNPSDKFMCKYADGNQNFVGYFFIFSASMPCIALKKIVIIIREKKILKYKYIILSKTQTISSTLARDSTASFVLMHFFALIL